MTALRIFVAKSIRTMDQGRPIAEAVAVCDGQLRLRVSPNHQREAGVH